MLQENEASRFIFVQKHKQMPKMQHETLRKPKAKAQKNKKKCNVYKEKRTFA